MTAVISSGRVTTTTLKEPMAQKFLAGANGIKLLEAQPSFSGSDIALAWDGDPRSNPVYKGQRRISHSEWR